MNRIFQVFMAAAIAAGFSLMPNVANAKRPEAKVEVVPATTPALFAKQSEQVRASMRGGGRYSDISASDRNQVESDMGRIAKLLQKRGSFEQLNDGEKTLLINAQEEANALLTHNDGDRLICRYQRKTGSHFREKVCQTASEIAKARNRTQEEFRRNTPPPPAKGN